MNIYTCDIEGFYPVGANALIVAENIEMALILINKEMKNYGWYELEAKDLKLQDNSTRRVDILSDGDY